MRKRIILLLLTALMLTITVYAACEHVFVSYTEPPTCEEPGYTGSVCIYCGQVKDLVNIDSTGHTPGTWLTELAPVCEQEGLEATACLTCGERLERKIKPLEHVFEAFVQPPTCGKDGYTLHTCVSCGSSFKTDYVDAPGHSYEATVVAPTCTADGYTRHLCAACGDAYRTDPVEKTGHRYDDGVITKEPTHTTMGRILYTCLGCGKTRTETTPKWENPFKDLDKRAYYFSGVLWASNSGITQGIAPDRFEPNGICTRGQVVTFLWRTAGKPEPEGECDFADVPADSYCAKAISWALEQGITKGVSQVAFAPEAPCTRAQVAVFIYRTQKPARVEPAADFRDVDPKAYYAEAVAWAAAVGITNGTSTDTFSPEGPCTRAQIVTFLDRARKIDQ